MELAPMSASSYSRVLNRNPLRTHSSTSRTAVAAATSHQGRSRSTAASARPGLAVSAGAAVSRSLLTLTRAPPHCGMLSPLRLEIAYARRPLRLAGARSHHRDRSGAGSRRASMYMVPPDRAVTSTAADAKANGRTATAAARAYSRMAGLWAAWRASLRRRAQVNEMARQVEGKPAIAEDAGLEAGRIGHRDDKRPAGGQERCRMAERPGGLAEMLKRMPEDDR